MTAANPSAINTVLTRMRDAGNKPAIFDRGKTSSYTDLFQNIEFWRLRLQRLGIGPGSVCAVHGDYNQETIAALFALIIEKSIAVPLTPAVEPEIAGFLEISSADLMIRVKSDGTWAHETPPHAEKPALVQTFTKTGHPGLIVFSSGSTGKPKGILHDLEAVMSKFVKERAGWRTVQFLLMDHFGGINTLLGTFAYRGVALCPPSRAPNDVCKIIEDGRATLLPTTPTFLNYLITSGAWQDVDLSSLKLISYGTEMMTVSTLERVRRIFPNVTVKQTYGLSEVGVVHSRSDSSDSVWVKVGGDGFHTRIVDGRLWIKSASNMVGYLNAEQPFDSEGWFDTGDRVEQCGEYVRFLGRDSETINVGGQKTLPVEIEDVLMSDRNVAEASVFGIPHRMLGQAVAARITMIESEDEREMSQRLRMICRQHLQKYKIPMRFDFIEPGAQHSARFKKVRNLTE